jgi:hypothetical protein
LNKNLPDNFVSNPEKILRKVMSKAESSHDLCLGRYNSANLTSMFEVMANKTLHEYSAPTPDNIRTGPAIAVGDAAF